MNLLTFKRFNGIRHSRTKQVLYGYLYVFFNENTCLKNGETYLKGSEFSFKVVAKTKKEAIELFKKEYEKN